MFYRHAGFRSNPWSMRCAAFGSTWHGPDNFREMERLARCPSDRLVHEQRTAVME